MIINNKSYKHYPKIRKEDIGKDTSNLFVDTLNIANQYLPAIGGDYDGDQCTVKGVWTLESNAELDQQMKSKRHYIGLSGKNERVGGHEAIQCLYSLTLLLDDSKHEKPVF